MRPPDAPHLGGTAERGGFEPPIPFRVCRFSKAVLSATQPPLRWARDYRESAGGRFIRVVRPVRQANLAPSQKRSGVRRPNGLRDTAVMLAPCLLFRWHAPPASFPASTFRRLLHPADRPDAAVRPGARSGHRRGRKKGLSGKRTRMSSERDGVRRAHRFARQSESVPSISPA